MRRIYLILLMCLTLFILTACGSRRSNQPTTAPTGTTTNSPSPTQIQTAKDNTPTPVAQKTYDFVCTHPYMYEILCPLLPEGKTATCLSSEAMETGKPTTDDERLIKAATKVFFLGQSDKWVMNYKTDSDKNKFYDLGTMIGSDLNYNLDFTYEENIWLNDDLCLKLSWALKDLTGSTQATSNLYDWYHMKSQKKEELLAQHPGCDPVGVGYVFVLGSPEKYNYLCSPLLDDDQASFVYYIDATPDYQFSEKELDFMFNMSGFFLNQGAGKILCPVGEEALMDSLVRQYNAHYDVNKLESCIFSIDTLNNAVKNGKSLYNYMSESFDTIYKESTGKGPKDVSYKEKTERWDKLLEGETTVIKQVVFRRLDSLVQ